MELHHFKNLLSQVASLSTRYKKIAQLTGENFNVFRILKMESSEVKMHSAFLAELLNPRGSHGQGDTFLKLFLKAFCFKQNLIDSASCSVEIERHTGLINSEGTEGGRIDILITDQKNRHHIIIENKIYAGDQLNQLTRYYNFSKTADLIYLTLDGKPPSKESKGSLDEGIHFKCYSYKHDIINWLGQCRKEAVTHPIIRESITQYINLIKYLTNQTINDNMQEELTDLLKANLEAAFLIEDNLDKTCEKLRNEFTLSLENLCKEYRLECSNDANFEKHYNGFYIYDPTWVYFNISFQFQSYDKELRFGVNHKNDPIEFPVPTDIKNKIKALPNNSTKNNDWWPWYNKLQDPYNDWSKYITWEAVADGTMLKLFREKIDFLLKLTKDIKL